MGNWRHVDARKILEKANTTTLSPAFPPPASSIRLIRDIFGMDEARRTSWSDQLCFLIVITKASKSQQKLKQPPSCSHLHWILSFLHWRVISYFDLSPKSEDWFIPTVISTSQLYHASLREKSATVLILDSQIPPLSHKKVAPKCN